ncbi:MAG: hypothetical protein L0Y54_07620, partial [Sporichthyaceae bacterium]|nr:hypothetical protein [Sporichthyaceae bacterium]
MHKVITLADTSWTEPDAEVAAHGYRRAELVGPGGGAVHTGLRCCELDAGGVVAEHLHSYESAFYVLDFNASAIFATRFISLTSCTRTICAPFRTLAVTAA